MGKEIMYYRQASNKWDSQFKTLADGVINTQTNQMQAQQYNNYAAHQPRHRLAGLECRRARGTPFLRGTATHRRFAVPALRSLRQIAQRAPHSNSQNGEI